MSETPPTPIGFQHDLKTLDVKEFREHGYLQEVNRQFLHPLGLALSVNILEDGTEEFGPVWDYREDPEGIYFDGGYGMDQDKIDTVRDEWAAKMKARIDLLGSVIQYPAGYTGAGRGGDE